MYNMSNYIGNCWLTKTADNRQHHYCFPHEITCVEWACAEFLIYTDDVCHYLHLGLWLSDLLCHKGNCFKQSINHYLYLGSNTCHQMKYGIFALSPQISFCRKTRWHCQKFTIIFLSQGVCLVEVKWPIYITKSSEWPSPLKRDTTLFEGMRI